MKKDILLSALPGRSPLDDEGLQRRLRAIAPADLLAYFKTVVTGSDILPLFILNQDGHTVLNGYFFPESEEMVLRVAEALADSPQLFPDIAATPAGLRERLDRAYALRILRDLFWFLGQVAEGCYRVEHASAVREALGVVRHVRADATQRYLPAPAHLRRFAMAAAEALPSRRYRRTQKKRAS